MIVFLPRVSDKHYNLKEKTDREVLTEGAVSGEQERRLALPFPI